MRFAYARISLAGIPAWFCLLIVGSGAHAQQPWPLPPPLSPVTTTLDDQNEIAGLKKGSKPQLLNWETVYALALVRARESRRLLSPSLDPAILGPQAARVGAADFVRFRTNFFAAAAFHDPAPDMLALLGAPSGD